MILRDITSDLGPIEMGGRREIPRPFWEDLTGYDFNHWDLDRGFFCNLGKEKYPLAYLEVSFLEKDVNDLAKFKVNGGSKPPSKYKERTRDSSWEDWVAAMASLAHEHQLSGSMRRMDLLDLINKRLERWGLEPKEESTVGPTARKVIQRFRSDPPTDPK